MSYIHSASLYSDIYFSSLPHCPSVSISSTVMIRMFCWRFFTHKSYGITKPSQRETRQHGLPVLGISTEPRHQRRHGESLTKQLSAVEATRFTKSCAAAASCYQFVINLSSISSVLCHNAVLSLLFLNGTTQWATRHS